MKSIVVIWYSWSNGNTRKIAKMAADSLHADMARIETVAEYTGSYDEVVEQGRHEVDSGYKPPINPLVFASETMMSSYWGLRHGGMA